MHIDSFRGNPSPYPSGSNHSSNDAIGNESGPKSGKGELLARKETTSLERLAASPTSWEKLAGTMTTAERFGASPTTADRLSGYNGGNSLGHRSADSTNVYSKGHGNTNLHPASNGPGTHITVTPDSGNSWPEVINDTGIGMVVGATGGVAYTGGTPAGMAVGAVMGGAGAFLGSVDIVVDRPAPLPVDTSNRPRLHAHRGSDGSQENLPNLPSAEPNAPHGSGMGPDGARVQGQRGSDGSQNPGPEVVGGGVAEVNAPSGSGMGPDGARGQERRGSDGSQDPGPGAAREGTVEVNAPSGSGMGPDGARGQGTRGSDGSQDPGPGDRGGEDAPAETNAPSGSGMGPDGSN